MVHSRRNHTIKVHQTLSELLNVLAQLECLLGSGILYRIQIRTREYAELACKNYSCRFVTDTKQQCPRFRKPIRPERA